MLQIQMLLHVAFNKTLQATSYPLPASFAEHAHNIREYIGEIDFIGVDLVLDTEC